MSKGHKVTVSDGSEPIAQVHGRDLRLDTGFVETEQGFKLTAQADDAKLADVLKQAVKDHPDQWSQYRVEQAIMDPDRITKTRVRVFHNGDGKPQVMVTFKGKNEGKEGNPKPRFELDLPVDLEMLAKMNPGRKVSDCLQELFRFGSEGLIGKDRYKFSPDGSGTRQKGSRVFDVDLYDWSQQALDHMSDKKRDLYRDLALVDVETDPGDKVQRLEEFPELLRPFVARKRDGALYDITGDKHFKGRTLTNQEASAGHFSLSQTIADLVDYISGSARSL